MGEAPTLKKEKLIGYPSIRVAGVDEVGRGCLAGAVYAAAVVLPEQVSYRRDPWLKSIRDSKLLGAEERAELAPRIREWAGAWCVAQADPAEIDRINIYHAAHLAMTRAIEGLGLRPQHVLVDGNAVPKRIAIPTTAVVKGDLQCLSIAAASILAKVARDQEMAEMESRYPGYGFADHKGYPTPQHVEALRTLGVTPIHRRSFAPVAALIPATESQLTLAPVLDPV